MLAASCFLKLESMSRDGCLNGYRDSAIIQALATLLLFHELQSCLLFP